MEEFTGKENQVVSGKKKLKAKKAVLQALSTSHALARVPSNTAAASTATNIVPHHNITFPEGYHETGTNLWNTIQKDPQSPTVWWNWIHYLRVRCKFDVNQLLETTKTALSFINTTKYIHDDGYAKILLVQCKFLYSLQKYDAAIDIYKAMLQKNIGRNLYYFWVNYATILQKSNQPKEAVKILHNALATVDFSEEDKKRVQTTLDSIVREIAMAPKSSKSPSPTHNNIPQNPELSQPTPKKEIIPLSSQTPKVSNLVTLSTPASKYTPLHERPEFHSLNRRKPRTLNRFPSKFQTGPERIRKSSGDSTNSSGISDIDVIEPPTDAPSHNQTTPNNQPPPSSPSRSELSTEQAPQPPPPKSPQQSTPKATQSQPQPPKSPMPNSGSVMASPAPSVSASNNTPSKDQAVSKTPRQATPSKDTSLRLQELVVHGRKYHCLGIMGKGGSSRVIKAIGGRKMDLFAIKQVDLTDQDEQTCEGFRNEINLLCSLKDESHIVHLFDYEITNKRLSLVLELGEIDLRHLLHRLKKQSPAANRINYVKLYWQQMLEAVQVIHKKRIVHGDLKPANFVSFKGVLKLIDFGIAGAIQSNTTNIKRDSMIGTLNYIAPEALDLKPNPKISMGVASDVWSMGIILYEMAYHTTPFASISNMLVKVQTIVSENHIIDFPDIGQPLLVQVLQSCLQRNPKKRATISQLLAHPFLA